MLTARQATTTREAAAVGKANQNSTYTVETIFIMPIIFMVDVNVSLNT